MPLSTLKSLTLASYVALILLILLWEGWAAPAPNAPPGIWVMLKAIPLLFPLRGLFRGRYRTYLLSTLLLLLYFTDGIVLTYVHWPDGLAWSRPLPYAIAELLISTSCLALALLYVKQAGKLGTV